MQLADHGLLEHPIIAMRRLIHDVIQIAYDRYGHNLLKGQPLQNLRVPYNLVRVLRHFHLRNIWYHPILVPQERAERSPLAIQTARLQVIG